MKKQNKFFTSLGTRSVRVGGYSVIAIAIVVALIVLANIVIAALPTSSTQIDLTPNKLYSLSDQTKKLLGSLQEDVTVYWVVQPGREDTVLENLLEQYNTASGKIHLETIDPDVNPTFIKTYIGEEMNNNSLVVKSDLRHRYVDLEEIYPEESDPNSYELVYNFAGEDALTSAIDYTTRKDLPTVGLLTGHGEATLDKSYTRKMELDNFIQKKITADKLDDTIDLLLIAAPTTDISAQESQAISAWLEKGGDLVLLSTVSQTGFPNLYACVKAYGISPVAGVIMEGSKQHTFYDNVTYLAPEILSHPVTAPILNINGTVQLPEAHGLAIAKELPQGVTATALAQTSEKAYSKTGAWPLETDEKEAGDIDGPFLLAVAATKTLSNGTSNVICVSSANLLNPSLFCDNLDLYMNCLNWVSGNSRGISIRAKTTDTSVLTINSDSAGTMKLIFIGIVPLSFLAVGIGVYNRRKRK